MTSKNASPFQNLFEDSCILAIFDGLRYKWQVGACPQKILRGINPPLPVLKTLLCQADGYRRQQVGIFRQRTGAQGSIDAVYSDIDYEYVYIMHRVN